MSTQGRVFASIFMLSGVTAMFVSIALLGDLVIKLELADYFGRRRRERMFGKLSDHFIVCGAGRVGRCVVEELLRSGVEVSVIENDPEQAKWALDRDLPVVVADATHDDTLRAARIESAAGLVAAIASDAENVYVTLTARVLNPKLRISARASDEQAEDKLRTAGATTVLTPYPFIGHRLAQSLLRPHVLSFLDVATAFSKSSERDLEIGQVRVSPSSPVVSKTLEESGIRQNYSLIVLAIQKPDEPMLFNPAPGTRIEVGDYLITMGEVSDLKRIETDFE